MRTRQALASVALLALACGGSSTGPTGSQACTTNVTVSVSAGASPSISWSPRCLAGEIIVDPGVDFTVDWDVATTDSTNTIQPFLTYGTAPTGTNTLAGPTALVSGNGYRVRVFRATGDSAAPFALIGAAAFSP
jgi:hypothetical protein